MTAANTEAVFTVSCDETGAIVSMKLDGAPEKSRAHALVTHLVNEMMEHHGCPNCVAAKVLGREHPN